MNNFYLPKILYDNISHISKEKKQSISKTITITKYILNML